MCNTGGKWQRVDLRYLYTRLSRIPRCLELNFPWLMLLTYMFFLNWLSLSFSLRVRESGSLLQFHPL